VWLKSVPELTSNSGNEVKLQLNQQLPKLVTLDVSKTGIDVRDEHPLKVLTKIVTPEVSVGASKDAKSEER
jgi:hypothetical protein